jgi:hypothetical protein
MNRTERDEARFLTLLVMLEKDTPKEKSSLRVRRDISWSEPQKVPKMIH